jgi:hypothetical protein
VVADPVPGTRGTQYVVSYATVDGVDGLPRFDGRATVEFAEDGRIEITAGVDAPSDLRTRIMEAMGDVADNCGTRDAWAGLKSLAEKHRVRLIGLGSKGGAWLAVGGELDEFSVGSAALCKRIGGSAVVVDAIVSRDNGIGDAVSEYVRECSQRVIDECNEIIRSSDTTQGRVYERLSREALDLSKFVESLADSTGDDLQAIVRACSGAVIQANQARSRSGALGQLYCAAAVVDEPTLVPVDPAPIPAPDAPDVVDEPAVDPETWEDFTDDPDDPVAMPVVPAIDDGNVYVGDVA